MTINRETDYKTTYPLYQDRIEIQYSIKFKEFVKNIIVELGAFKKNNFEKKYKDYASVLKSEVNEVVVEIGSK